MIMQGVAFTIATAAFFAAHSTRPGGHFGPEGLTSLCMCSDGASSLGHAHLLAGFFYTGAQAFLSATPAVICPQWLRRGHPPVVATTSFSRRGFQLSYTVVSAILLFAFPLGQIARRAHSSSIATCCGPSGRRPPPNPPLRGRAATVQLFAISLSRPAVSLPLILDTYFRAHHARGPFFLT